MLGLKRAGRFGRWNFDDVFRPVPQSRRTRRTTPAGVLSGGEQQMLTMCRTLMGDPDLILIDEPTEGLAPMLVEQVGDLLAEIARGVSILLVEQKLTIALKISQRLYVMGHGRIVFEGSPADLATKAKSAGSGWRFSPSPPTGRDPASAKPLTDRSSDACDEVARHFARRSMDSRLRSTNP